jgi:predicted nucleic acid-binding protein
MTKAVFDSDVLIDYLQGIPAAREEMERYDLLLYSVISFMELLAGARTDEERRAAEALLASLRRVDLTESIARRAVDLRQSLRLKLPDAIVLATAEVEGCILVTRNTRDFPANDPRVRFPYTV